jgi:hypothetical protein
MARVAWRHRPDVCLQGEYPERVRCQTSCFYVRMPEYGRPYVPLLISTNMYPLCTYDRWLYWSMIDCGVAEMGIIMYSYHAIGIPR